MLTQIKNAVISSSIIYLITGLLFLIFPAFISNFICYIIGALILVLSVSKFNTYFNTKSTNIFSKTTLVLSILLLLLGMYILLNPEKVASIIPIIAGVFIIVDSLNKYKYAFELREVDNKNYITVLLSASLLIIFGIILISNPFTAITMTIRVIGILLMLSGINDIYTINTMKKVLK